MEQVLNQRRQVWDKPLMATKSQRLLLYNSYILKGTLKSNFTKSHIAISLPDLDLISLR